MSVSRRLLQYATLYKRMILIALVMLAISVTADLMGPFVAKAMINRHITGIQQTWYQTPGREPDATLYQNHWYKRGDRFTKGEERGAPITLMEVGAGFYVVHQALPNMTNPQLHGASVTVDSNGKSMTVKAQRLTKLQLFHFYQPEIPGMWFLAGLYFALLVVSTVFTYGQRYLLQVAANRILRKMRRDVFHQIHRLPIQYFDNTPAGKVVSRITNDTEAIRDFYVAVMSNVVSGIVNMIGIYIALFILNVTLALICVVLLPILVVWIVLYRKYAVTINGRIRALLSDINAMINETIQGVPVIRAFNREERTAQEFEAINNAYYEGQTKLLGINSATGFNLTNVLRNIFLISLMAFFGWRYLHLEGLVSFGVLYAFIDYLGRLFQPVQQIVQQLANLEQARVSASRVFELLDEDGTDVANGSMERYRGDVVFDNVTFSYDDKVDVLKGISFAAKQGQSVALVGHTGSGKSSIMNLLFRFYDPQSGTITIDGVPIHSMPRQHLRRHMGIVLQDPFLFTGTLASNVNLGDESISRERIEGALRNVGADKLLGGLPGGLDAPVLEKGSTLSAGQRQLISFARALAFNPAILVLDEATSSIDTETESVIQDALEVLKRGRTTFIIAHRLSTIRNADLILVLDKGVVVERGSHEDLMANRGRYYHMYQLQQGNVSA
ncbi:ABC transporter ATP-binding protein [Alicyclobacillus sp. ALC3]|uniref:ABC transporter ATP-binding protein n=1 Tax=Alicyclobacillus sp. ALC3 TaxID=2796143 RepID=UPI00237897E7|nr:ABC transporter ATP-binding protein [Alicyclobacillus sp. ALC3]WDL98469.1 ABC transporter ATP-binding protein [Alicyclobacillus sp. ALC3]